MSTTIHGIGKKLEQVIEGDRVKVDSNLSLDNLNIDTLNIDLAAIGEGSRVSSLVLPKETPTLIKSGPEQLKNRSAVLIINESEHTVYIGFDTNADEDHGIPIYGGCERVLTMKSNQAAKLYGYCSEEVKIIICEVK